MPEQSYPWEQPLGAHPAGDGRVRFRVWAPKPESVAVRVRGADHPLTESGFGVYEATIDAAHGDDYWYVLDGEPSPDPCSRWQPEGIRGPSRVVDPATFTWTDGGWEGVKLADLVVYELHIGTFTEAGTLDAAIDHLPELADLGITAVELLPVAAFPGEFGWGYDGVYISATQQSYGGPEALQRFTDAAHRHGIAVLLDVVYNHVGASGNQALAAFGPYFTDTISTFWGDALNYSSEDCDPVREWVLQSAEGWIRDFHLDGLRLDAIHAIHDDSAEHLVAAISRRVHDANPAAIVIAESGLNDPKVMRPADRGGWVCDAAWADDFHHALRVLLTGDRSGYYEEFGEVAQLAKAFHRPHVHDGTYSTFRRRRFGAPADDLPPEAFVVFDQNHDQVGNRAFGDRLPVEARPLAAFTTLLSPFVPMLFQGEEHGDDSPFQFFADHIDEEIAIATRDGRRREFSAFAEFSAEEVPDPTDPETFRRSKLARRGAPEGLRDLYKDLIAMRRRLPYGDVDEVRAEGQVLHIRRGDHRMVCNFGAEDVRVDGALVLGAGDARQEDVVVVGPLAGALVR